MFVCLFVDFDRFLLTGRSLSLSFCFFAGFIPPSFGDLVNLVVLNLSWNFLSGKCDTRARSAFRRVWLLLLLVVHKNLKRTAVTLPDYDYLLALSVSPGLFTRGDP